jgi:GT2 family glycosyltransferase
VAKGKFLAHTQAQLRAFASLVSAPFLEPRHDPAQLLFLADAEVNPLRPQRTHTSAARPALAAAKRPPLIDARPEVSVVLGSFNRFNLLRRAIESVRANLNRLRGEIIVVDGGSSDGSIDWLVEQKDIVAIVQHNRYLNDGQPRRRMSWGQFMNMGFRAAGAERILMISDDCYLLPDALPNALTRIDEAERTGLTVGACAFYFRNWPEESEYYVQRTLGGNLMVNHGIYCRGALAAAGYVNEDDYAFYKADSDLSLAIWQAGFAIIDAPGSVCEHFMSPEEAVRVSNNATLEHDRRQLHKRWRALTGRAATRKMGKKKLDWRDESRAAERVFGDQLRTARPSETADQA